MNPIGLGFIDLGVQQDLHVVAHWRKEPFIGFDAHSLLIQCQS